MHGLFELPAVQCLGMFLMIPITLAFHGVANTNDHIGYGDRDCITK